MELILIQSKEHETLPIAELKAVLATEEIATEIECVNTGLILLKSLDWRKFRETYKILVKRLAYTHEIDEIILNTSLNNFEDDFKSIDWNGFISNSYAVRVKRFNNPEIDTISTEKRLGHLIKSQNSDFNVNLENPDSFIRVIISDNRVFIAIERFKLNKKHFQNVKPHKRPFFYPGSMSPKLARCMVNLSHVKEGQLLLDPFCGTGGILIEGGLVGAKLIGSDINWKMKNGTIINLDYCNLEDYEVYHVDVRELKLFKKVDAVVTDPPYGISTSTGGEESPIIFQQFLESISKYMIENAYLCIAHPHYLDIDPMLNDYNFKLLERHQIKMHKSLTRIISVIQKCGL
ncbi:MAG: TIGR01177 family methyltransferase [Methanobacteriaceae archaeon]|jgi:tRNA (guanine10-N2)-dimethyltransferase|nr:TIGR01177 family methyltransferase [Candidatus Methanorudis spinitermitis]